MKYLCDINLKQLQKVFPSMLIWETQQVTVCVAANLGIGRWCWMWMLCAGTQQEIHPSPLTLGFLIQDLAAKLSRKTAVALKSHKQDIRHTLSQYTHMSRGVCWLRGQWLVLRDKGAQTHPHDADNHTHKHRVQVSHFICLGLLLSTRTCVW